MAEPAPTEILHGALPDGRTWAVEVSGDLGDLYSLVNISEGDRLLAGKGFGGPALYPGEAVNYYWGKTDELPYVVLVRTKASVMKVTVETSSGMNLQLTMSDPNERFGTLRFGFAALADDSEPVVLTAEGSDGAVERYPTPHR